MTKISKEQEINQCISAMRDSVWVINSEIQKEIDKNTLNRIRGNVEHLELMMSKTDIIDSGKDLSDVSEAIDIGNSFYEENKSILQSES
jgi:hypothetical protein